MPDNKVYILSSLDYDMLYEKYVNINPFRRYPMFCPKCKCEYTEGIITCPDCKLELVEKNEENITIMRAMKPVKVKSAVSNLEAEMILNILQDNKIPCYKKSREAGGYLNIHMGYSIYGEDIYVDEEDYEAAMEIISVIAMEEPAGNINGNSLDNSSVKDENAEKEESLPFFRNPRIAARIILIVMLGTFLLSAVLNMMK